MAEQGKIHDHKVTVAHTNFIGSCFARFSGKVPRNMGLSTDKGPRLLLRRGGGQGISWGVGWVVGEKLLCVGSVAVAQQPGGQSLGSENSEERPGFGVSMAWGLSRASPCGVGFFRGMQNRQALNGYKNLLVWPILKINGCVKI